MSMPLLALVNPQEEAPLIPGEWATYFWYEAWYWTMLAGFTYGFSLRTEGHVTSPTRPSPTAGNHTSFLDPVAIGLAARRHLTYLARKTLFTGNKLFGRFLESVNCVPVDQEGVATEGLKTTIRELVAGKAVLVFPEGDAPRHGRMIPLRARRSSHHQAESGADHSRRHRRAVSMLTRSAAAPKWSPLFLPATKATLAVSVGKPLDPQRYANMPREVALKDLLKI